MSKTLMYQYGSLSTATAAVLRHYKKLGFLEVVPFDIPMTGEYLLRTRLNFLLLNSCQTLTALQTKQITLQSK